MEWSPLGEQHYIAARDYLVAGGASYPTGRHARGVRAMRRGSPFPVRACLAAAHYGGKSATSAYSGNHLWCIWQRVLRAAGSTIWLDGRITEFFQVFADALAFCYECCTPTRPTLDGHARWRVGCGQCRRRAPDPRRGA